MAIEYVPKQPVPKWWYSNERPEGYYFWDENELSCYGPFLTKEEAEKSERMYYATH